MGAAVYSKLARSNVWAKASGWQKFALVNCVANYLGYWIPNTLLFLVAKFGLFQQYKIQKNAAPPASLVWEAIRNQVVDDFVLLPLISYPFYKLITLTIGTSSNSNTGEDAKQQSQHDNMAVYQPNREQIANEQDSMAEAVTAKQAPQVTSPVGWAGLQFDEASKPSLLTSLWQVAVAYLGYDFMFYWSHRFLHSKYLYKTVHKQHHRFRTSVGIASSFQHPVEGFIQLLNWFLPIAFAGWLNKKFTHGKSGLHMVTLMRYGLFRWVETTDAHCGYDFPFSFFARIPLFGSARAHDVHHSGDGLEMVELDDGTVWADFGNYGATVIWDNICGTVSRGSSS